MNDGFFQMGKFALSLFLALGIKFSYLYLPRRQRTHSPHAPPSVGFQPHPDGTAHQVNWEENFGIAAMINSNFITFTMLYLRV